MVLRARLAIAIFAAVVAFPLQARADAIFNVTLNTAGLVAPPSGDPFWLFFQFTDGSGTGDANNSATISGLNLGGGTLLPDISSDGGIAGDPVTGLTMTDSSFFNFYSQAFQPGAALTFQLSMTTNLSAPGAAPDLFGFSILDALFAPIPTLDPTFADLLLSVTLDSPNPSVASYGSDPARTDSIVNAPDVRPVPEPGTLTLLVIGAATALAGRRHRRGAKQRAEVTDTFVQ